jgi:hypothetical protein
MTLEEFAERHLDQRDALALRARRGERLSQQEAAKLDWLNATLDRLLPKPAPLPREISEAMERARRLLGT